MSELIAFTQYQSEALIICLLGSILWAGVLLAGARGLERSGAMSSAEKLWIGALLFAVLPSLAAPTLAAFGISLRPEPVAIVVDHLEPATIAVGAEIDAPQHAPRIEPFDAEKAVGAAAIIYVYGVFLAFFLWAGRNAALYYAISRATPLEDKKLLDRIEDWAERLDVCMPTIRRSRHVSSVCIFGVLRQTILIPEGIERRVASDDLVLMCAHELAHVRRGDTRLFTATQLARVLFWFNPLVGRIAANAEIAAEEGADALVLTKGVDRRVYAAVFVEGLKFAAYKMTAQPALAPSFTPVDRQGRRRRLNAILTGNTPRKSPLATRLMLSAAASAVALAAVGQAAFAVDPASASARRTVLRDLPIVGDITQGFGEKSRFAGKESRAHEGVDIRAPKGAKVFAPGDGVVVEATDLYRGEPSWGKVVVLDHGHGLITRYAHLDNYRVKKGDRVRAGDVIAAVGSTGKSTGPHLHFETLRGGVAVDPKTVVATEPQDVIEPAPTIDPVDAVEPWPEPAVSPAPAEIPDPVIALTPAPHAAVGQFPAPPQAAEFPGFKIIKPVVTAAAPVIASGGFHYTEPTNFAFADGSDITDRMISDVEERLLGGMDSENGAVFDLTLRNGDKIYRFSSNEPMTAEKREELREALDEMRRAREETISGARAALEESRRAAREHQIEMRRATDRANREAARHRYAFEMSEEEREALRKELEISRREQLEFQREAIEDARADFESDAEESFEDAFADLEDAERDLNDAELSSDEMKYARLQIEAARRQLERDREVHKRAIEETRGRLDAQRAEIERQIEALDAVN